MIYFTLCCSADKCTWVHNTLSSEILHQGILVIWQNNRQFVYRPFPTHAVPHMPLFGLVVGMPEPSVDMGMLNVLSPPPPHHHMQFIMGHHLVFLH